jgi:hypothetical protein
VEGRPQRGSVPDPYRVRPLPFEDVYLFRKHIDNSGVVRLANGPAQWRCLKTVAMMGLLVMLVLAAFYPQLYRVTAGYELSRQRALQQRLLEEQGELEVAEAQLSSPERLRRLAPELEFKAPAPSEVVYLNPAGDGTALALNTEPR